MTGTKRLDKTTRDFRGFQNDKLQLSKGIDVYTPTYRNDGGRGRVRNVIYLICDGMGLSQITAAAYANCGLTLMNFNYIGLQRNNALGAFTTDSAAGGSALATGERHANRHISMTEQGEAVPSLSDWFRGKGLPVGVVTLGNAVDATPTAFYGHSSERDNADELTRCLLDTPVDLLCGSGIRQFTERGDGIDLIGELSKSYRFVRSIDEINAAEGRVVCIDERMDEAAEESNLGLLAEETRAAIDASCAAFRLPTCSRKFPRDIGKERPCLNHHMGRCDAFCRGTPDEDEYMRRIGQAEELLNGHYRRLTRALREEMEQEAADLHFEQAAALRDRIRAIEVLGKRQKVIAGICADTDIWGVYRGALKCGSAVLHIEDGSVTGRDLNLFAAPQDESEQMILSALLPQYYLNKSVLPREILLPCEIEGADELAQILTERAGRKVTLHVPQRGEKAELLAMAQRNAREDVERVTTAQERENRTLTQLAGMLSLPEPPGRMESYDISNTGASDIVASMVVYEGAKPKKSAYRRFKIKSLSAHPDDYASMEEVLTRRIQRYLDGDEKFSPLPDVMLIDGGITHAGVAERVCAQMHVHVPIFGMVKDDRHRTRALVTAQGREIDLHTAPNVFALIGQIQEETHRFAITFHHESHSRSSTRSALDGIPGVGKVRVQALLKTFKSVRAIREADIFALERVLPKDAAASVYLHFHGETDEKKDEM